MSEYQPLNPTFTMTNQMMAHRLAEQAAEAGGRAYFVGGYVRDSLLGRENKDIDIEIHGLTPVRLEAILNRLGEPLVMGASFGIYGLRHYGLDIALPRSETALGRGHRDFRVDVDPFLGTVKAAQRRDFTMNALMMDVLTGEVIDHFGGRADLERGILRHVRADTFVEDPLRVLRAAQFAARFGFTVAEETVALCAGMELSALSRERVFGELAKALEKSPRPSVFFETLRQMGQLEVWFPEVSALRAVEQPPSHHPEGNVWNHTMQVLDEAAALREQAQHPLWLLLAALCHDLGKAQATCVVKGALHAYGHEQMGLPLTERFLSRLTAETALKRYLLNMVELHMKPNAHLANGARDKTFMGMFDRAVCPEDLLLLAKADHLGRRGCPEDGPKLAAEYAPMEEALRGRLADYRALMARPYVMGRDLIEAGMTPGPEFTQALALAHKLRLAGVGKEAALRQVVGRRRES